MRRVGLMVMVVALVVVGSLVPAAGQTDAVIRLSVTYREEPPNLHVLASATIAGGTRVRVTISPEGGATRELFSSRVGDDWSRSLPADPCDLGGSDLPGAQFAARIEAATGETGDSLDVDVVLSPDRTKPRFLEPPFDASPKPGDQVEAGEEIGFEVTAVEQNPPKVWQTGVHTLEVTGPRGPIGRPQQAGASAKACEAKSKSLTVQDSYRVRRSDPAVIELCAVAEDYVPNQTKKCAKWYKGEVWEGTFTGTEMGGECVLEVEGTLSLVVAKDGSVTGEGQRTDTSVGCSNTGAFTNTVSISGRATDRAFEIFGFTTVDGGPFRIPKSGTRARRSSFMTTQDPDVYSVELRCVSC